MHPLLSKTTIALVVTALAQGAAQAALFAVDPGNLESTCPPTAISPPGIRTPMVEPSICACPRLSVLRVAQRAGRPDLHVLVAARTRRFRRHHNRWSSRPTSPTKRSGSTAEGTIVDAARGIDLTLWLGP